MKTLLILASIVGCRSIKHTDGNEHSISTIATALLNPIDTAELAKAIGDGDDTTAKEITESLARKRKLFRKGASKVYDAVRSLTSKEKSASKVFRAYQQLQERKGLSSLLQFGESLLEFVADPDAKALRSDLMAELPGDVLDEFDVGEKEVRGSNGRRSQEFEEENTYRSNKRQRRQFDDVDENEDRDNYANVEDFQEYRTPPRSTRNADVSKNRTNYSMENDEEINEPWDQYRTSSRNSSRNTKSSDNRSNNQHPTHWTLENEVA